jgi:hypothetical protein
MTVTNRSDTFINSCEPKFSNFRLIVLERVNHATIKLIFIPVEAGQNLQRKITLSGVFSNSSWSITVHFL